MLRHPLLAAMIVVGPAAALYLIARHLEDEVRNRPVRPPAPAAGSPSPRPLDAPAPGRVDRLMACVRDSRDLSARVEAVWDLAKLRDDDGAILRFLRETACLGEPVVAPSALEAIRLHMLTNPSAAPELMAVLLCVATRPIDAATRTAAIRILDFDRIDTILLPDFLALLKDPDSEVRRAVVGVLAPSRLRAERALAALAHAYRTEPRGSLRREVIDRIAEMEDPDSRTVLESLKGCWPEDDPYIDGYLEPGGF